MKIRKGSIAYYAYKGRYAIVMVVMLYVGYMACMHIATVCVLR
jgi:hypothetical protein